MARLLIKTAEIPVRAYDLKEGTNRVGRSARNDLQLEHPTVSSHHCEVEWLDGKVRVRDCDSTNGTYIDGEPVQEAPLYSGQSLHVGKVEMELDGADAVIAVPAIPLPEALPGPTILPDGTRTCPNHPEMRAAYRCTECKQLLCDACVHKLRRVGGKALLLCPLCSHTCEVLGPRKRKRFSLLELFRKTLKLPPRQKKEEVSDNQPTH